MVAAPRPEIFDLERDPGETKNLLAEADSEQRKARRELAAHLEKFPLAGTPPVVDPEVAAQLRSLGYLSGQSREFGGLDPKDGALLLAQLAAAGQLEAQGQLPQAKQRVAELVAKSPKSIPFLARLAGLEAALGEKEAALATLDRALQLCPSSISSTSNAATCCSPSAAKRTPPRPSGSPSASIPGSPPPGCASPKWPCAPAGRRKKKSC